MLMSVIYVTNCYTRRCPKQWGPQGPTAKIKQPISRFDHQFDGLFFKNITQNRTEETWFPWMSFSGLEPTRASHGCPSNPSWLLLAKFTTFDVGFVLISHPFKLLNALLLGSVKYTILQATRCFFGFTSVHSSKWWHCENWCCMTIWNTYVFVYIYIYIKCMYTCVYI